MHRNPLSARAYLISFVALLTACSPEQDPSKEQRAEQLFSQWDKDNSPGGSVFVLRDDQVLYRHSFGLASLVHKTPIKAETVFELGSTSKTFLAFCALLLAEQGLVSLADDVRQYVPELPDYGHTITLAHLLEHTSGLRDLAILFQLAAISNIDALSRAQILDLIARQKALNFPPGTDHAYSNTGYFLVGLIIERVSRQSLDEFARQHVFEPLAMQHSFFFEDPFRLVANRADGHFLRPQLGQSVFRSNMNNLGASGLHTTIDDLLLWERNFYANKIGASGQALIDRWMRPYYLPDGRQIENAYGLLVGEYRGLKTVRHGGNHAGFKSHLLRFPQLQCTVGILANTREMPTRPLTYAMAEIFLEEEFKTPPPAISSAPPPNPPIEPIQLSKSELAEYAGRYFSDELKATHELKVHRGTLTAQTREFNPRVPFVFVEKDKALIPAARLEFNFARNEAGEIVSFVVHSQRVRNLEFKRI